MQREDVTIEWPRLAAWSREESDEQRVAGILEALKSADELVARPILRDIVSRPRLPLTNRLGALAAFVSAMPPGDGDDLVSFGSHLEDGPVLAAVLREIGSRPKLEATDLLLSELGSPSADVRSEAIRALGLRGSVEAREAVVKSLDDEHAKVRQAAAEAAGQLEVTDAADKLLAFTNHEEPALIRASLVSLRQLQDSRALTPAVEALDRSETQLAATRYVRAFGDPGLVDRIVQIAATNPSFEFSEGSRRNSQRLDAAVSRLGNSDRVCNRRSSRS